MLNNKKLLSIVLGLLLIINKSKYGSLFSLDFTDIREIISLGHEITKGALESLEFIRSEDNDNGELKFPFIKRINQRILDKMDIINHRINYFDDKVDRRLDEIKDILLKEIPRRDRLYRRFDDFYIYINRINDIHNDYLDYTHSSKFENKTLLEFAKACVDYKNDALPQLLKTIYHRFGESDFLLDLAKNTQEAAAQICSEQQSPQQLLYNLYNVIAMSEVKGLVMMQFSYSILSNYYNGTYSAEMKKTREDYKQRMAKTLRNVRTAMVFAPKDLWRCDPDRQVDGKTYTKLNELFQGYIVNEVDLNQQQTCRENCPYYSYAKVHSCFKNQYCSKQRTCNGKVVNCQFIDSDMWICPSDKNSNRRYEYIEYENGKVFGNKGTCKKSINKVDSWWRWLFWHCSYCMCYCDDHSANSERYFNLRDVVADVKNNKVVVGLKFVKVNQIIHIQIQEGTLMKRGLINDTTVSWKPVDNYTIIDLDVVNGRDFHTISWEKRAIDLDDLNAPEDHVVTGVRFRVLGAHLNLEIQVTPFNFSTGKLMMPTVKSTWNGNDNTDVGNSPESKRRTELKLTSPDIPTRINAPSFPDSNTNQFLNFAPTDLEKDAAQTTIPFIDIQPVSTSPPFALSGVGLIHKGRTGSGGYLALKLMTYDFTNHIQYIYTDTESESLLKLNDISK